MPSAALAQAAKPVSHVHAAGKLRIYYHTEGQHAVDPADMNHNAIPDQVEDALTQTQAAQLLWEQVLGFPDPFQTERYRGASFLDIHFRHKDLLKSNGVTYDELQHYNRPGDPKGTTSLCFNLATSTQPNSNLTPAHEFFHIIQNSVTYFKNRWFTEGTARWSERGLGLGDLGPGKILGPWPLPEEKAKALFGAAYDASATLWNPLAAKLDPLGTLPASPAMESLKAMTYVNGTPVLQDQRLTGWAFIRDVLQALDKADDIAFRELGHDKWSEAYQRAPQNDAYILRAVEETVRIHEERAGQGR